MCSIDQRKGFYKNYYTVKTIFKTFIYVQLYMCIDNVIRKQIKLAEARYSMWPYKTNLHI